MVGPSAEHGSGARPAVLDEYVGFLLRRVSTQAVRAARAVLPSGTTPRDVAVLRVLAGRAAYSQHELARRLGLERSMAVEVVDGLLAAGYVDRIRNPYDRRSYRVSITPAGRAAIPVLVPLVTRGEDALTAGLRTADRRKLDDLLAQVLTELEPGLPPTVTRRTSLLIAKMHDHLRRRGNEELAPLGIQARDFWALQALAEHQPCRVRQLAAAVGREESAVTPTLNGLDRTGLVERRRDPANRRQHALRLTDAGAATLDAARQVMDKIEDGVATSIGDDGRADLQRLLRLLI